MKTILLLLFATLQLSVFGQDFKVNYAETKKLKTRKDGYISEFIGTTQNYLITYNYAISNASTRGPKYIVSYDRRTLEEVKRIRINDSKKKSLWFVGAKINGNEITLIFNTHNWQNFFQSTTGMVLDENLNTVTPLKELASKKDLLISSNSIYKDAVMIQSKDSTKSALILEFKNNEKSNITMGIIYFDSNLSNILIDKTDIPITQSIQSPIPWLTGRYDFGANGVVHARHIIAQTDQEAKEIWKNGKANILVNRFDPTVGKFEMTTLQHPKNCLIDAKVLEVDSKTVYVGLYIDPNNIDQGYYAHGMFRTSVDENTAEFSPIDFNLFKIEDYQKMHKLEGKQILPLPYDDRSPNEYMGDMTIEEIAQDNEGNLVVFTSMSFNYLEIRDEIRGNGYFCQKSDVNTFRYSPSGDFVYIGNLRRNCVFSGLNVKDLQIQYSNGTFKIHFLDKLNFSSKEQLRAIHRRKNGRREYHYAILNTSDWSLTRDRIKIEQNSSQSKKIRFINPRSVKVIGDEVYSFNIIKRNGLRAIPTSLTFFFTWIISSHYPSMYARFYGSLIQLETIYTRD